MGKIVKNQFIDKEKVRQMCIKYNLYNRGSNAEYTKMFNLCDNAPTNSRLKEIAKDIWSHSSGESLADLNDYLNIMDMLYNRCVVTYFGEVR